MIIDAVLTTWKRDEYLPEVVEGLKKQSCLRDIYVWHNDLDGKEMEGVYNIYSEKNFKCLARHSFALSLKADYIVFTDDDFILEQDYSDYIQQGVEHFGEYAVLGPEGVLVDMERALKTGSYYDWKDFKVYPERPCFVDIIKGRFHIVKREYIPYTFLNEAQVDNSFELSEEDDISLNLSIQCAINRPSVLIPMPKFKELNLGGLNQRSDHFPKRSLLVRRFIQNGWRSKISSKA